MRRNEIQKEKVQAYAALPGQSGSQFKSPVPAIGQGTWFLGESMAKREAETEALQAGILCGMTLIDTAEMYGGGKSEQLIGRAIKPFDRSSLFLVSKVYPQNAGRRDMKKSCDDSLARLGTDYLDLYLLHWRGGIPLEETVECMEELIREGKIRRWGVSNFDTDDMEELWRVPGGEACAVNQVLYHLGSRGVEFDLLPWMRAHKVPLMAYCPLAQGGDLKRNLYTNPVLKRIASVHSCTAAQLLLAWAIRDGSTIAIPRSGSKAHVLENGAASQIKLTKEELESLDKEFPAPNRKMHLDIV